MKKEYKKLRADVVEVTEKTEEIYEKTIAEVEDEIAMAQKKIDELQTEKTAITNALQ